MGLREASPLPLESASNNSPRVEGTLASATPFKMPMAFPTSVIERGAGMRAVVLTVGLSLLAAFALVHIVFVPDDQPLAPEEFAQASSQAQASSSEDAMQMPPLPTLTRTPPRINLKLQKEGHQARQALRDNLAAVGEDQHPTPANKGLEDLKVHIAVQNPIPLMPDPPEMPPAVHHHTQQKIHEAHAAAANQVGVKHPASHVDKAEKEISHAEAQKDMSGAGKKMMKLAKAEKALSKKVTKASHKARKVTKTTEAETLPKKLPVVVKPHTDLQCCNLWGPHYKVRRDKCDKFKACHASCHQGGRSCYCCKRG